MTSHCMNKKHETKVCVAVLDYIYARKGIEIDSSKIEIPEKQDHENEAIDLFYNAIATALEHTILESFMGQKGKIEIVQKITKRFKKYLDNKLPKPGHYELVIDVGATKDMKDEAVVKRLASWIINTAPLLEIGSFNTNPNHFRKGQPDGVPFEVTLRRWPRKDGKFIIVPNCPEFEASRRERIEKALNDKCPKLVAKAKSEKGISVLILEMNDFVLGDAIKVATIIQELSRERAELPDDIYIVDTYSDEWDIRVIKKGKLFFKDLNDIGPYRLPIPQYCDTILRFFLRQ